MEAIKYSWSKSRTVESMEAYAAWCCKVNICKWQSISKTKINQCHISVTLLLSICHFFAEDSTDMKEQDFS